MPAVAKLMCMSGHNAYFGCRFCNLKGTFSEKSRHVYYPCSMPRGSSISDYNPEDLPNRTEHDFFNDVMKIQREHTKNLRNTYIKETGIINLFESDLSSYIISAISDIIFFYFAYLIRN
jgi:hypothetical protein